MDSYPQQQFTGEVTPHQATMLFDVATTFLAREGSMMGFDGGETGKRHHFSPDDQLYEFRTGAEDIIVTAFDDSDYPPHTDQFSVLAVRISHHFPDFDIAGRMSGWIDIRKILFVKPGECTERFVYEKVHAKGNKPQLEDDLALSEKMNRLAQKLEQYGSERDVRRFGVVRKPFERADVSDLITLITSRPL